MEEIPAHGVIAGTGSAGGHSDDYLTQRRAWFGSPRLKILARAWVGGSVPPPIFSHILSLAGSNTGAHQGGVSRPRVWCAPRQRAEPQQRALTRLPRSVHSRRKEWEFHLVFRLFIEPTNATPLNVAVQQPWLLLQLPSMGWCVTPTPHAKHGRKTHPRNPTPRTSKSHPHHADTATLLGRNKSEEVGSGR
jgi:hypothetical protein